MSTLGSARNIHKATLDDRYLDNPMCFYCGEHIKRVPGGHGPTWVHVDTGAVAGRHDPENARVKARQLVEDVLRDADWVIPELARLLTDDLLMFDYDSTHADSDRYVAFMQRMNNLLHNVVDLRLLSNEHREAAARGES
jgi:hypothetical protein